MIKQNLTERKKQKKAENARIIKLIDNMMACDPRIKRLVHTAISFLLDERETSSSYLISTCPSICHTACRSHKQAEKDAKENVKKQKENAKLIAYAKKMEAQKAGQSAKLQAEAGNHALSRSHLTPTS